MDWIIKPSSKVSGIVTPPGDKSITHRAIMISSLAEGVSVIENYLNSDDCMRTLKAFQDLGVKIEKTTASLRVTGAGLKGLKAPAGVIDAGNSGTTTRLLCGVLAGQNFSATITGDDSLSRRPMKRIMEPLAKMGAKITANNGEYLPMTVTGASNLRPLLFASPLSSAQVKSCILLAGIQANGTTSFQEPTKSRDHTERMLCAFGADIKAGKFSVTVKGPAVLKAQKLTVPGDISSAAFFLVAGAVAPSARITLYNVGINPTRDGIIEVLRAMGAKITFTKNSEVSGEPVAHLTVETSELKGIEIKKDIMPRLIDEIPIIALAATQAHGTTVISGAGELRVKESDRIRTIASELRKMGAQIQERPDGLIITGPTPLRGTETESYDDHRIAMMLSIAGLIARGETRVKNTNCVDTSYPGFMSELQKLTE